MSFRDTVCAIVASARDAGVALSLAKLRDAISIALTERPYAAAMAADKAGKLAAPALPPAYLAQACERYALDPAAFERAFVALPTADLKKSEAPDEASAWTKFDALLAAALAEDAAYVHLRAQPNGTTVLFRVHGDLVAPKSLDATIDDKALTRVLASAHRADNDQPEDFTPMRSQRGRIERTLPDTGSRVLLAWYLEPMVQGGYDVVLKVLPSEAQKRRSMHDLGFSETQVEKLTELVGRPTGLILICGASGSGKSTTLQALSALVHGGKSKPRTTQIIDVENTKGLAARVRVALKADPDCLVFPEVRDAAVASKVEDAVLTGHLVLTTILAAGPIEAIGRLSLFGISHKQLVTDGFLSAVVYQRLVPTLCPSCRTPWLDSADARALRRRNALEKALGEDASCAFVRGPGCGECRGLGVNGQVAVAQVVVPTRKMRQAMAEGGLHGLHESFLQSLEYVSCAATLVREGRISVEEM